MVVVWGVVVVVLLVVVVVVVVLWAGMRVGVSLVLSQGVSPVLLLGSVRRRRRRRRRRGRRLVVERGAGRGHVLLPCFSFPFLFLSLSVPFPSLSVSLLLPLSFPGSVLMTKGWRTETATGTKKGTKMMVMRAK